MKKIYFLLLFSLIIIPFVYSEEIIENSTISENNTIVNDTKRITYNIVPSDNYSVPTLNPDMVANSAGSVDKEENKEKFNKDTIDESKKEINTPLEEFKMPEEQNVEEVKKEQEIKTYNSLKNNITYGILAIVIGVILFFIILKIYGKIKYGKASKTENNIDEQVRK